MVLIGREENTLRKSHLLLDNDDYHHYYVHHHHDQCNLLGAFACENCLSTLPLTSSLTYTFPLFTQPLFLWQFS